MLTMWRAPAAAEMRAPQACRHACACARCSATRSLRPPLLATLQPLQPCICGQLSRLVAENIFSFDAKFWMRVATRNDSVTDPVEKERLKGVADTVMLLVDAMVRQTEQQLNDSAAVLQVRDSSQGQGLRAAAAVALADLLR